MSVNSKNVYLISGQLRDRTDDGAIKIAPKIEQIVVVADTNVEAYQLLSSQVPHFSPVGHATLLDFEQAVEKIRAALTGKPSAWKVLNAPSLHV